MPKRIGDRIVIIPGDYVVIQSTENGDRYPAEIIQVIDYEYELFYRAHNVWPKEYDVAGYVERLGEKLLRIQAAEERDKKLKKQRKHCEPSDISGSDTSKKKKKKEKTKVVKCKRTKKFDTDCLANTSLFVDDGLPLGSEDDVEPLRNNITDSDINTRNAINSETNNWKQNTAPSSNNSTCCTKSWRGGQSGKVIETRGNISSWCNKSCCGEKSVDKKDTKDTSSGWAIDTKSTGTGPHGTDIVASVEELPPLYGKCTPWQGNTNKKFKKGCTKADY